MKKKTALILSLIFIVALGLRIFAYYILGRVENPLFWEYHSIANNFIDGKGLSYYFLGTTHFAYAEPFYCLLSYFFYYFTEHNYFLFGLINILFSGLLTIVIFFIGRLLFDEAIALLSAFLVALHPGLIYFSTEFHPLTFNVLFFSIVMLFLLRLSKTHRVKDALLSGAFIGIAFLDRAIALIFIPLFFTLMLQIKAPLKTKLKLFILTLTIASLAVAAWGVRNYSLFHKLILSRSSTGYLFWLGNNPNSTGSAMFDKNQSMLDTLGKDTLSQLKTMDELSQNEYFKETALLFVKQRPLDFLLRYFKKFYYFWWFSPQVGSLYHFNFLFIYKLFYSIMIFLAVSGLYIIAKKKSQMQNVYIFGVAFAVMCCLALAAVQSLFYIEGRHRWVIEPIIMIFSSFTFFFILRTIRYGIHETRKM